MYKVLSKDTIEKEIVSYLPTPKRGFKTEVTLNEIVNCILYKLKTGIQWHLLPISHLFSNKTLHYKTIFGYYRKWCKENVWKTCWIGFLSQNKAKIDLSSGDFDGSHTITLRGGEEVGYQGRKKRKTTNSLYFTDRQGLPLAMSNPVSGNHHDLYDIELHFDEIINTLQQATIAVDGLFMNADAGFDAENLRRICEQKGIIANVAQNKRNSGRDDELYFDEKLYKERYSIERANAWLDSFRSLLNRFDTTVSSWIGFHYLAFITLACKKFKKLR